MTMRARPANAHVRKEEVVDAMYALVIKQTIENPQCIHYTRWYPPVMLVGL